MTKMDIKIKTFVNHYLKTFNATQAYLKVNPNVSNGSAGTAGHRMLNRTDVQLLLQGKVNERDENQLVTIAGLTSEAREVKAEALKNKDHSAALRSIELQAKLHNLFNRDSDGAAGYNTLVQSLTVNVGAGGVDSLMAREVEDVNNQNEFVHVESGSGCTGEQMHGQNAQVVEDELEDSESEEVAVSSDESHADVERHG